MTTCPRCETDNEPSKPLCDRCGADVRTSVCPRCRRPMVAARTVCAECGAKPATSRQPPSITYFVAIAVVAVYAWTLLALLRPGLDGVPLSQGAVWTLCAFGGVVGPLLYAGLAWWLGLRSIVSLGSALGAVGLGVFVAVPLAVALTIALPLVALGIGAFLVAPIAIGLAEEAAKALAAPLADRRGALITARHGFAIGFCAGLGFAAIENCLYIARSYEVGGFDMARNTVLIRLVSSLAHGAWTACLCAMLWRERRVSFQFSRAALMVYVTVALLHAVWDINLIDMDPNRMLVGPIASGLGTAAMLGYCLMHLNRWSEPRSMTLP